MKTIIVEVLPDMDCPICVDFEEENTIIVDIVEEEKLIVSI